MSGRIAVGVLGATGAVGQKFIKLLSDNNASLTDEIARPLLGSSVRFIEKEYSDKAGAIAIVSRIFFDLMNSSLELTGMDAYEPGPRAFLLSDPALDTAYQAITQLLTSSELELASPIRQQMSKDLRELAPNLSKDLNKLSVLEFCNLLDKEEKLNKNQIISISQILKEETAAREKFKKLDAVYRTIRHVREEIKTKNYQEPTLNERKDLSETLREFADVSTLETKALTHQLCQVLENKDEKLNIPHNRTLIKSVYSLLKQEHDLQTGLLEKAAEVLIPKINRWFVGMSAQFHPSESKSKTEYYRTLFESKEAPPLQEAPVIDLFYETAHQISLLKTNISRAALGYMVCYLGKISPKDKEGDWIIRHISTPHESFKNALDRQIEEADISWLRKQIVKLSCRILEPTLSYYVDQFITNFTKDIKHWIDLPPTQQLEILVQALIDPLGDYLTTLIKIYADHLGSQENTPPTFQLIGGSPEEKIVTHQTLADIEEAVSKLQKNDKLDISLPRLTDKLINNILKYTPRFNWAVEASQHFQEKAQQEPLHFNKLWWSGWSRFFHNLSYLTSLTQWVVDRTLHFFIKNSLKKVFHSLFSSSEKNTNYIHWINSFLRENLEKINKESASSKTAPLTDDESINDIPKKVEDKIFNVLELTRQVVALHTDCGNATAVFKGQESFLAKLKGDVLQEILSLAKPFILGQVTPLLETITNPKLLQNGWLNTLKKINEIGFNPTPAKPPGDPGQVERAMLNELETFLRKKIGKALDDLHNPKESLQRIVTSYFETSKKKLAKMDVKNLPVAEILSNWLNLVSWRENRTAHLETVLSRDIIDLIYDFNKEFILKSKAFDLAINTLSATTHAMSKNEAILKEHENIKKNLSPDSSKMPYNKKSIQELPVNDNIKKYMNLLIKSKDQLHNEATVSYIKKCIDSSIKEYFKKEQEKLTQQINTLKDQVQTEFLTLSKWVTEQKPPEIQLQPSLILRLLSPLLANPTTNAFLITIAKANSAEILKFLNQEYHYPLIFQFILRGYLKRA